jgi:hypothetical protein
MLRGWHWEIWQGQAWEQSPTESIQWLGVTGETIPLILPPSALCLLQLRMRIPLLSSGNCIVINILNQLSGSVPRLSSGLAHSESRVASNSLSNKRFQRFSHPYVFT